MIGLVASPFGNLTVLWSGLAKESDKTKQEIQDRFLHGRSLEGRQNY